jgi:hypothetical protein
MFGRMKTLAFCGVVGLAALAAAPAGADSLYFDAGGYRHGPHAGIAAGDHIRRDDRADRRWDRRGFAMREACTPWRAADKARRMGVRHPRVSYETRRSIGIRGWDRAGPIELLFARAPDCPLIR